MSASQCEQCLHSAEDHQRDAKFELGECFARRCTCERFIEDRANVRLDRPPHVPKRPRRR